MKLVRLEDIILYKITKSTGPDGQRIDNTIRITPHQAIVQYLIDDLSVKLYGSDVDKVLRIATINHKLEKMLLPKVQNKEDNISKYFVEYKSNNYSILKVTPKYIDIKWR